VANNLLLRYLHRLGNHRRLARNLNPLNTVLQLARLLRPPQQNIDFLFPQLCFPPPQGVDFGGYCC